MFFFRDSLVDTRTRVCIYSHTYICMSFFRDSLVDIRMRVCIHSHTYICMSVFRDSLSLETVYTARKASWNKAGVDPVH